MKPGDRLTLLFGESGIHVPTRAPYGLVEAVDHLQGIEPQIAEKLQVVVVEVIGVGDAVDRAERDTMPAPPAAEFTHGDGERDEIAW